jgi:hypothetical protein
VVGLTRRTIERLLRRAGVKGRPHRFRDTFSLLLEKGEQLRTAQLPLGTTASIPLKSTTLHRSIPSNLRSMQPGQSSISGRLFRKILVQNLVQPEMLR